MCKKSLEKVITGIGIKENEILNNGSVTAASYDDWYIAGIVNENGEVTYTLIKLREPNDEQGAKGSAVSFVELNIKALSGSLEKVKNGKANYADKNILCTVLFQVTNGKKNPSSKELADANKQLLQYFRDSSSDGSYLIAEQFVKKFISGDVLDTNGNYQIPTTVSVLEYLIHMLLFQMQG